MPASNDVLVTTCDDPAEAERLQRVLADAIVALDLQGDFGIAVRRIDAVWPLTYGVYLGRHDDGPVAPTPAVLHAAERIGRRHR